MSNLIIIGIGNPFRGDDGVGWAVVDSLKTKIGEGLNVQRSRGDISELLEAFTRYSTVYLVDACCMKAPVGLWDRIDVLKTSLPLDNKQTSTHGFNLSQVIDIAKALNQLPSKLIIYVVNGGSYEIGERLSSAVEKAIEDVVQMILTEEDIQECMKRA